MKKEKTEFSSRIKKLLKERKETQGQLSKHLGVAQRTVSAWVRGEDVPSPQNLYILGQYASGSDRDWFLLKAEQHDPAVLVAAEEVMKQRRVALSEGEMIRVRYVQKTAEGFEPRPELLPLPSGFVANPAATVCLLIDQNTRTEMFSPGECLILDTSETTAPDLRPFWDEIVLVDIDANHGRKIDPEFTWGGWPDGLSMGRLRWKELEWPLKLPFKLKAYPLNRWFATLGPFDDRDIKWKPNNLEYKGFYVGYWRPVPPNRWGSMEEAEAFHAEAARQAPSKIRLEDACRIVGRVIGWHKPPAAKGAD
jgi:transcriptional regulator with XRE-family HTH domain